MPFTEQEKQSLLAQKGIGPTILKRLQEMGLDDVSQLAKTNPDFTATGSGHHWIHLLEKQPAGTQSD